MNLERNLNIECDCETVDALNSILINKRTSITGKCSNLGTNFHMNMSYGVCACASKPCKNNGTCHAVVNTTKYECFCQKEFFGEQCEHGEIQKL